MWFKLDSVVTLRYRGSRWAGYQTSDFTRDHIPLPSASPVPAGREWKAEGCPPSPLGTKPMQKLSVTAGCDGH